MKFFHIFLLFAFLMPVPQAMAQSLMLEKFQDAEPLPPVLKPEESPKAVQNFANKYYADCMKKTGKYLLSISRKDFCTCTSAQIAASVTMEDLSIMGKPPSKETEEKYAEIAFNVYGPCMEQPLRDRAVYDCMINKELRDKSRYMPKVCNCVGDYMEEYWWTRGVPLLLTERKKRNASPDPFERYMKHPAYPVKKNYFENKCYYAVHFGPQTPTLDMPDVQPVH